MAGWLPTIARSAADLVESLGSDVIPHVGGDAGTALAHCVARLSARGRLRVGETAQLAPHVDRLHIIDGESGEAIA